MIEFIVLSGFFGATGLVLLGLANEKDLGSRPPRLAFVVVRAASYRSIRAEDMASTVAKTFANADVVNLRQMPECMTCPPVFRFLHSAV